MDIRAFFKKMDRTKKIGIGALEQNGSLAVGNTLAGTRLF